MSRRPDKKLNRLRRAINKTGSTPKHLHLIQWLKFRRYAKSTAEAELMLLEGRVKAGPNAVGREWDPQRSRWILNPYCDAALRGELRVVDG